MGWNFDRHNSGVSSAWMDSLVLEEDLVLQLTWRLRVCFSETIKIVYFVLTNDSDFIPSYTFMLLSVFYPVRYLISNQIPDKIDFISDD